MQEVAKAYVARRNALLENDDVEGLYQLLLEVNPYGTASKMSQHVKEIMFHKARTSAQSVTMSKRSISKAWLKKAGCEPLDDGDVP